MSRHAKNYEVFASFTSEFLSKARTSYSDQGEPVARVMQHGELMPLAAIARESGSERRNLRRWLRGHNGREEVGRPGIVELVRAEEGKVIKTGQFYYIREFWENAQLYGKHYPITFHHWAEKDEIPYQVMSDIIIPRADKTPAVVTKTAAAPAITERRVNMQDTYQTIMPDPAEESLLVYTGKMRVKETAITEVLKELTGLFNGTQEATTREELEDSCRALAVFTASVYAHVKYNNT